MSHETLIGGVPPIDLKTPDCLETATFALG